MILLDSLSVCPGNPDASFMEMADYRKGTFFSPQGKTTAYVDNISVTVNGFNYTLVQYDQVNVILSSVAASVKHVRHFEIS